MCGGDEDRYAVAIRAVVPVTGDVRERAGILSIQLAPITVCPLISNNCFNL